MMFTIWNSFKNMHYILFTEKDEVFIDCLYLSLILQCYFDLQKVYIISVGGITRPWERGGGTMFYFILWNYWLIMPIYSCDFFCQLGIQFSHRKTYFNKMLNFKVLFVTFCYNVILLFVICYNVSLWKTMRISDRNTLLYKFYCFQLEEYSRPNGGRLKIVWNRLTKIRWHLTYLAILILVFW